MKRLILSVFGLVVAVVLQAAPITSRQAAKNVRAFLSVPSRMMFANTTLKMVSPEEGIRPYYVFNIGDNDGFVIASGDDAAYSILGYSDKGHIDINNMPDNMKSWLDGYAKEITSIQKLNLPARKAYAYAEKTRVNVPALLTSQWAQDYPYNAQCPDYGDGFGNRPTGCVATAIAQVMYYHRWPKEATSKIDGYSYEDNEAWGGDGSTRTESALEPTTFDWCSMMDRYSDDSEENSKNAVANLMNYVGHSVKMMYGAYSSGAYATDIVPALVNNFGYKNTAKLLYREYSTQEEWDDIIYNEVANGRPVLYFGATKSYSGHQFVCDGYENEFFHINWGWRGTSDGFFKLSALCPEEQGIGGAGDGDGFTEIQSAVIGIDVPVREDEMFAQNVESKVGEEAAFNVMFKNVAENYVSMQFDITLPEGISIVEEEVSFNADRSENKDHKVEVKTDDNRTYHFDIISSTGSLITGISGSLVNVPVVISADLDKGSHKAELKNIILSNNKQEEKVLSSSSFNFNLILPDLSGDADNSGVIDEADVTTIINYMMSRSIGSFNYGLADVNSDGYIDIADVVLTWDIILKNAGKDRNIVPTEINKDDKLFVSAAQDGGMLLNMNNTTGCKAMQMDIMLSDGLKITDVVPSDKRIAGFKVDYSELSEGRYRLIFYSEEGACVAMNEGTLFKVITDKTAVKADIKNVIFVTSDLRKLKIDDVEYILPSGIDSVTFDNKGNNVYTLDGVLVGNDVSKLNTGVYIVNDKKIIVK